MKLPLIGAYQAANALVSAGLVIWRPAAMPQQTFDALSRLQPVRGRLERAAITSAGAPVYVDYAHTPDALAAAIAALRPHAAGRADHGVRRGRRPRHGQARRRWAEVAAANADVVIVTDDNPRGEDPAAIRAMVLPGRSGARARSATGARRLPPPLPKRGRTISC